jgi:hypothetical protein
MTKRLAAVVAATVLLVPQARSQSILQKSNWRGSDFATCLAAPAPSVWWLNSGTRTQLTKRDAPVGRPAGSIGPLVLKPPPDSKTWLTSNTPSY